MSELLSWTADADNKIIPRLLALHSPCDDPRILDVCCNRRYMWRETGYTPIGADIDPAQHPDVVADCRALPFAAGTFDVLVFDPPHIPGLQTRMAGTDYSKKYGLGMLDSVKERAIMDLFAPFLREAARVLTAGGIVLAKLANTTYWDARLWHTHEFWAAAAGVKGLHFCDELVKVRPAPMPQPNATQYHTLSAHSTWIVVRKGTCQGRGLIRPRKPQQATMLLDAVWPRERITR